MNETQYDKQEVQRLMALPDEAQDETEGLEIHVGGEGYYYGDYEIAEVSFWFDRVTVTIDTYDDPTPDDFDLLTFGAEVADDGTVVITREAVGLVPPAEARESDTPGANSSEDVYDLLEELGFRLEVEE